MKYIGIIAAISFSASANAPVESCLTYTFNEVKISSATLILNNIFDNHLHGELAAKFPDLEVDWTKWSTEAKNFVSDSGIKRTSMEACFDVTSIYQNTDLVSDIMKIANDRFVAGLKHYSSKESKHIEKDKIDSMLTGFEPLIKKPEVQEYIDSKLTEDSTKK
ncbi:hypothetical protein RI845_06365 [Thalassotalea nanhaiensis]|uniref:Uncharacterized protein n=1 Tax=Thalassotalea nanhaiensis TaxID=3065648 RepID=A0ABY9TLP8_9GAMM|nr:hypothetical protein RI845_06365 [Colwelliaceae bacterium SQ345]